MLSLWFLASLAALSIVLNGCGNTMTMNLVSTTETAVEYHSPMILGSGETLSVYGSGLDEKVSFRIAGTTLQAVKVSDNQLAIVIPEGLEAGEQVIEASKGDKDLGSLSIWMKAANDKVYSDLPADKVCQGATFIAEDGSEQEGHKTCASPDPAAKPDCSAALRTDCVATDEYPAIDKASLALNPDFLSQLSIAGVKGQIADCAAGSSNCFLPAYSILAQPLKAADKNKIVPSLIKLGSSIAGVDGSLPYNPADCSLDGENNCLSSLAFPAADVALIQSNKASIRSAQSIAGVAGTLPDCSVDGSNCYLPPFAAGTQPKKAVDYESIQASLIKLGSNISDITGTMTVPFSDCTGDDQSSCLAVAAFPAVNKAYISSNVSKIDSSLTIAGVSGTLNACASDGGTACTTVSAFPAIDKSNLNSQKAKVGSTMTLAGISGTLGDCSANGSGCRLPAYSNGIQPLKAISYDSLSSSAIKNGSTISDITGTVLQAPADCGSDGQTNCVTVSNFPAADKAVVTAGQSKILDTLTFAGVSGSMPSCNADAQTSCLTSSNYPAADKANANTNKAKFSSSLTIAGISGTLASCSADGQTACKSVSNYPASDKNYLNSNKALIHDSLTLAGVSGTMTSCAANGSDCYLAAYASGTQSLKAINYDGISAGIIKTGTTVAGIAGNVVESPANCAGDSETDCVAISNFPSMDKVSINANKAKILSTLTLGGVTGTAGTCASDGASACLTDSSFPAIDKSNVNSNKAKIDSSVTLGGISGTMTNCAANGSDCYLPTYAPGTQNKKAINFNDITAAVIKSGSTIAGVNGSMLEAPAICNSDGGTNCVTDTNYPSMVYATINAAKDKILPSLTAGAVTGTLGNCSTDGGSSCYTTAAYPSFNKNAVNTDKAKIRSSLTIASIAGTLGTCSANGSNCYLPTYVTSTQPLKAINFDILDPSTILTGNSISTVAGTLSAAPSDCNGNAQTSCVAVANYPAIDKGNANTNKAKIHSSINAGGIVGTLSDCSTEGGTSCLTTAAYPAVLLSNVNSNKAKMRSSLSIAGISGTLADCSSLGSDCFLPSYVASTQPLKAINFDGITAGVIKSGSSIAGVTGQYPSASYPLSPGDAYTDLSGGSFDSQIVTSTTYGWFNRNGTRQSHAGDADIIAANIKSGTSIFGVTGTFVIPAAWDVRVGTAASASVSGYLKPDCRNLVNTSVWDAGEAKMASINGTTELVSIPNHGWADGTPVRMGYSPTTGGGNLSDVTTYYVRDSSTNSFRVAASVGGAALDLSTGTDFGFFKVNDGVVGENDTIDHYNNAAGSLPIGMPWGANYACSGVDSTGTSSNVWKDVTVGGCASGKECRYKDQINNLEWSKRFSTGFWSNAQRYCDALVYDGQSNWRLPTQSELFEATSHGMVSALNANWITYASDYFGNSWWSSTKRSDVTANAWFNDVAWGTYTSHSAMSNAGSIVCVRKEGENL